MEDGTNDYGMYPSIAINIPNHRSRSRHGIHLTTPIVPNYAPSSQYTPSSVPSPISFSRSISPLDGCFFPEMDIPAPGEVSHDLAGMSFQFDGIPAQIPTNADLGTFSFQVPTDHPAGDDHSVDELKADLEQLAVKVKFRLSQHESTELYEMKDLLRATFNRLDVVIQRQIDSTDHFPANAGNGTKYLCYLCSTKNRRLYGDRGTFRRHVADRHCPQFRYRCLVGCCHWKSTRRDKVHYHMRQYHGYRGRLTREQINLVETKLASPNVCGLCPNGVGCWSDYFKCVSKHCRIPGNRSTDSSASQSRRGSDDRGPGGGYGFDGSQFPGDGFGANGPQSFPHGTGNNGGFGFFNAGQNPGSFGNGVSAGVGNVNQTENESTSSHSPGETDSASSVATPDSSAKGASNVTASSVPSNLASHHLSLMQKTLPADAERCDPAPPRDHSQSSEAHDSDSSDASDRGVPRSTNRFDGLPKQKPHPPVRELPEKRCKFCGHSVDNCDRCHSMKETISQCHMCANMASETCAGHPTNRTPTFNENQMPTPADMNARFPISTEDSGHYRDITSGLQGQLYQKILTTSKDMGLDFANATPIEKIPSVDSLLSLAFGRLVVSTDCSIGSALTHSVMKQSGSRLQELRPETSEKTQEKELPEPPHMCDNGDLHVAKKRVGAWNAPSEMQLHHGTYRILSAYVPHIERFSFFSHTHGCGKSPEADILRVASSLDGACLSLFRFP
ncbi:hypothetical protein BO71DRAFT_125318 [Aspergillus ellipticus CBS 707.79]|uniref:C2H2-type domain-containing protein n=1 Tax=Aspergillus ellipticus CBS 707.79 TaxID=1448320 RepID=A0A319CW09_9EURO|nr:hypothetical protein BO71DRAFT_125318 [Aspergillus ellipticus CBS 707.79]